MKIIRIISVLLFFAVLLTPLAAFNFKEGVASAIDNRMLAENPFARDASESGAEQEVQQEAPPERLGEEARMQIAYTAAKSAAEERPVRSFSAERAQTSSSGSLLTGDLTTDLENYVSDRIGLRDEMILAYTLLNDRLFGKMVHPTYVYGQDGYVFGAGRSVGLPYTEYHEAFADMILRLQNYCEARGVPFLFAFNPAKPAVLTEYLPKGMNYDRDWVDSLLRALDERGVNYVDTTPVLRERSAAGEAVFNQKYDANHWNSLGAYYGTRAILERLQTFVPNVRVTAPEELERSEILRTSLPVSTFPIRELVPELNVKGMTLTDETERYASLYRDPSYTAYGYLVNEQRRAEGAPRALVFQGSYMLEFGSRFFANAFGEYIYVHDYQNVLDLDYYFSVFQPDCVVFETAEYTVGDMYYGYQKMLEMDLNPALTEVAPQDLLTSEETVMVTHRDGLTTIFWPCETAKVDHAWVTLSGQTFDLYRTEAGFETTLTTDAYLAWERAQS